MLIKYIFIFVEITTYLDLNMERIEYSVWKIHLAMETSAQQANLEMKQDIFLYI